MKPLRLPIAVLLAVISFASMPITGAAAVFSLGDSGAAIAASPAAPDSGADGDDLAPTAAAPWNPPRPVSSAEPWETALGIPLRIATFPLSLLRLGLEGRLLQVEEASLVPRVRAAFTMAPRIGVGVLPASLGDRTGLGATLHARPLLLGGWLGADLSGSTHDYARTRADLGQGPARLTYAYDWRPRERFFDVSLGTSHAVASTYAARTRRITLSLAYPWSEPGRRPPRGQIGIWAGPREMILRRGREAPSFDAAFPGTAGLLDRRQEHFIYGTRLALDRRAGAPHWSHGFRAAAEVERFGKQIETLSIRDGRTEAPQFTRMSFEGEGAVSFMRDPRTLRFLVRVVKQTGRTGTAPRLIPDLMGLGGHQGLSGFEPGRFHDVDLVLGKLGYVFSLARHVEFELHAESGGVYPELERARLSTFKSSFGVALRPRSAWAPLASLGIDWSSESVRLRYSLGGVE